MNSSLDLDFLHNFTLFNHTPLFCPIPSQGLDLEFLIPSLTSFKGDQLCNEKPPHDPSRNYSLLWPLHQLPSNTFISIQS